MMNYCNRVMSFINYALSNLKNISGNGISCLCKRCKNKKFINPDIVAIHLLQKGFIEKYLCWYAHGEPYVPYETMIERMVESTSSSSNMYEVVDDNNNYYRSMVIDAIIVLNQGYAGEYSIIDEELNACAVRFFKLLRNYDKPL